MTRAQRVGKGLVGLGIALTVTACAESDVREGPAPAEVRAVVLPFLSAAPFHIAAEEGYFEEQNLDVEFVKLARAVEAIPALARGEVDVAYGQITITLLNAIASGARLRLVAGTSYVDSESCTAHAVVARREIVESGRLNRPEDLVGLRVELDVLLPMAYYVHRALEPAGLTIDDLDIVNLPIPSNYDALIVGSIDVTVTSEPYVSRMVESGEAVVWRGAEEIVPDLQVSSVLFGPNLLDERPEVGKRFVMALRKAMRQYEQGKTPRNVDILARATGLAPDELKQICWPALREDGRVGIDGSMAYQRWLASRGLIDRVVPPEELLDERFIEHANAILNP